MAGFYTDLPIIPVSLIRTCHTYDAATGIFSITLKIDWVTQKVERSKQYHMWCIVALLFRNYSKGFQTNVLPICYDVHG